MHEYGSPGEDELILAQYLFDHVIHPPPASSPVPRKEAENASLGQSATAKQDLLAAEVEC